MTYQSTILQHMQANPHRWFLVSDFQRDGSGCPFIGYEAGTKISQLLRQGFIISRWSNIRAQSGRQLKEYACATVSLQDAFLPPQI